METRSAMTVFMRWMFALLLLANIALFAMTQFQSQGNAGGDSMASHTPYNAEQIHLLPEAELAQTQQQVPATVQQAAPPPQICLEWGIFTQPDLARVQNALQTLQLEEDAITVRNVPEKSSKYWVYIPPLKSKQDAQKKQEELKELGIEDSLIIQDGNKWRYAISLGVFSTQEAADKQLAQIRTKNIKTAKAGPRTPEDSRASLLIRSSGTNLEMDLIKLKQDFQGTELKAVPCSN